MLLRDYAQRHGFGTVGNVRVFALAAGIELGDLGPFDNVPEDTRTRLDERLDHIRSHEHAGR